MKIATFNINNVNRRLSNLLAWLDTSEPDVVCLQELKAADHEFPIAAIESAGVRRRVVRAANMEWRGDSGARCAAVVTHRTLPGDAADSQRPYLEAAIRRCVGDVDLRTNGNPRPAQSSTTSWPGSIG